MTRSIQLHPLSLLVGVGFALLGVAAMGQMPAANRPAAAHDSGLLQVAHPRDWVVVEEGAPYVVPAGRILVVTALGATTNNNDAVSLLIDGKLALQSVDQVAYANGCTLKELPVGLSTSAESTVEVSGVTFPIARAWGYLVDA